MSLKEYKKKRRFDVTPEPSGGAATPAAAPAKPVSDERTDKPQAKKQKPLIYVIQKHRASHLHYDFRLEWDGALLSWAVPKGPSLDPATKRLAMQVEDHPVEYATFEGTIPEGEYGGGTVMVWDQGTWEPDEQDVSAFLQKGDLKFTLHGKKLKGSWVLVRTRGYGKAASRSWLLIKHRDQYASTEDIAETQPRSVISKRLLAEIASDNGGDVEKAATGDPVAKPRTRPAPKRAAAPKQRRRRSV